MLNRLGGFLKNAANNMFSGGVVDADPGSCIYAGPEKNPVEESGYEFWVYALVNDSAVLLPARALDGEVIDQLKNMEVGDSFKITEEADDGPLGVFVKAIEVDSDAPAYKIPEDKPPIMKI